MNSLSKFSLAMAFSTALFCLLMLSRGFAAGTERTEQYVFMGHDRAGKVVLSMDLNHHQTAQGARTRNTMRLFTERDGWVRIREHAPLAVPNRVGGHSASALQGGFPGAITFDSPEQKLSFQLKADRIAIRKQGFVLADGRGTLDWKGRKLEGVVLMRMAPENPEKLVEKALGAAPGDWRESLNLSMVSGGTLQLFRQSNPKQGGMESFLGGYLMTDSFSGPVEGLEMQATAWAKIGFYKLPFAWQGSFSVEGKRILFRMTSERLDNHGNWLMKGKRTGLAKGFIKIDGVSHPAFGLSEVEHFMQSKEKVRAFETAHKYVAPQPGMSWETAKK